MAGWLHGDRHSLLRQDTLVPHRHDGALEEIYAYLVCRLLLEKKKNSFLTRDKSTTERDVAAGRQTLDPICDRGSRRRRNPEHHDRHRAREKCDRRPLRCFVRTGTCSRRTRQGRAAERNPRNLEHDQRELCSTEG